MEGRQLSPWAVSELRSLGSDGPFKVLYFRNIQEFLEAGGAIPRNYGDPKYYSSHPEAGKKKGGEFKGGENKGGEESGGSGRRKEEKAKERKEEEKKGKNDSNSTRHITKIEEFLSKLFPEFKVLEFVLKLAIGDTETGPSIPSVGGRNYNWGDYTGAIHACKYALVFGSTTEFNPSGIWVVEDHYNDADG